jgi:hypothetical protein
MGDRIATFVSGALLRAIGRRKDTSAFFEPPLAEQAERLLVSHFSAYWKQHRSTAKQHQEVIAAIHERISMTSVDVLRQLLDRRPAISSLKIAGILDKIVDSVYGGASNFFFKLLCSGRR